MTDSKIAFVSGSYPPRVCGIADYTSLLAAAMRDRGARVTTYTKANETATADGVRPIAPNWGAAGVHALIAAWFAERPDIVHLQWGPGVYDQRAAVPLLLPRLLRRANLPLITTFHSLDGPAAWGKAHRLALLPLLLASRSIVVCSQRQLHALQRLPRIGARTTLLPIGSNIPVTHARRRATPAPAVEEGPRLVYFGFVWRGRNVETVLRVLRAVREAGLPKATLEIVGGVKDDAYRAELEHLAVEIGVADGIRFRGDLPADSVSEILAGADLVLLPFSSGVSTGRGTLMAALAHHAPIMTTGAADNMSPLFEDGSNMRIVAVDDEAAFIAGAVALAGDGALRARLSEGASRLAESFKSGIAAQTLSLPVYRAALAT